MVLWSLFFFACGGKSADTGGDAELTPATFTDVENQLLGVSCAFSTCHGANAGGLMLDGINDYDRLVNVEAINGNGIYVIPGDADGSYLVHKVEGGPDIMGDQMPNSQGISAEQLQILRSWIDNGAPND